VLALGGVTWKWHEAEQQKQHAQSEEERARALAVAEGRAHRTTGLALNSLAANQVAALYMRLSGGGSTDAAHRTPVRVHAVDGQANPEAVKELRQACERLEKLLAEAPSVPVQVALATSYARLSVLQAGARDTEGALRSCRRGLELLDQGVGTDAEAAGDPEK